MQEPFFTARTSAGSRLVLRVGGECDSSTLSELNNALNEAIAEGPQELIVDLAHATFVDSLTLGALTIAAQRTRANGGVFRVVRAVAPEVRRAFEITGLDLHLIAGSAF